MLALALASAITCAVCIAFIDRPVEMFFHGHRAARHLFQLLAAPSLLTLPAASAFLLAALWRHLTGAPPLPDARLWMAMSVATLVATSAKDELKWLFGRPWPDSWVDLGLYMFHPFSNSYLYGGFPSGHTAYIAAPMCVLWQLVPRWRWGAVGITAAVMVGLVGAGYHFVGDVIAGFFTGLAAAAGTLALLG